jgi:uncharacterized protein (DUF2344 family)
LDFPLPLTLGVVGMNEFFDFAVTELPENLGVYTEKLNAVLPSGIRIIEIAPPIHDRMEIALAAYEIRLSGVSADELSNFFAQEKIEAKKFSKKSGEKIIDLKPSIGDLEINETGSGIILRLTLPAGNKLNINSSVLTETIKKAFPEKTEILYEIRTNLLLENGNEFR